MKTSDGGDTWAHQLTEFNPRSRMLDVSAADVDHAWVAGENNNLYRTCDGGESWDAVLSAGIRKINGLLLVDEGKVWAVGENMVIKTTE